MTPRITGMPGTARCIAAGWRCVAVLAAALLTGSVASALHAQPRAPIIQERVRLDPTEPVGFHVLVVPDTVYVGQQATYEMGVFITESAQQRMRRNPEVVPAELRSVLAYDLGGPQSLSAIVQNGQRTFPHVLQRALFGLASGTIMIPSSQLTYSLPRTSSYFSREETAAVRAGEVTLHVKPLPETDRPDGFLGAVGVIALRSRLDAAAGRVGEPVVLTVQVGGRGNIKLWPRPTVSAASASVVPAGERVAVDTTGQFVRGTKEFDWLVTPEREGRLIIPVVQYPYFDPYAEEYRIAAADSLTLPVSAGEFVPSDGEAEERAVLGIRRTDRGPLRAPLAEHPAVWALLAIAPVPAVWWRRRRPRALPSGRSSAATGTSRTEGAVRAMPAGAEVDPVRVAAASLRRRFVETLADRLDTSPAMLVERRLLQRRLRRRGVTREGTADIMRFLAELDEAAWSRGGTATHASDTASWTDRMRALTARVEAEAIPSHGARATRSPGNRPSGGGFSGTGSSGNGSSGHGSPGNGSSSGTRALWMLLAGGALAFGVAMSLHARNADFADAVASYDAGEYTAAAARFTALARSTPRHADAWANAGTASWAARDTVGAVIGWQRALRLEPMADDVRERLGLLSVGSRGGLAEVPSMPRDSAVLLAVVLWCAGWGALAWSARLGARQARREHGGAYATPAAAMAGIDARSHRRAVQSSGVMLLGLSVGAGLWHVMLSSRLDGERLAIVTGIESLRVVPGRDANANGGAARGDVVARGEARLDGGETWIAVEHADGRAGWLPEHVLQPLR